MAQQRREALDRDYRLMVHGSGQNGDKNTVPSSKQQTKTPRERGF
jgi:hypothetical protein